MPEAAFTFGGQGDGKKPTEEPTEQQPESGREGEKCCVCMTFVAAFLEEGGGLQGQMLQGQQKRGRGQPRV